MKKKEVKEMLRIMKEYAEACVANDISFMFRGIVSFRIMDTVTTLKP